MIIPMNMIYRYGSKQFVYGSWVAKLGDTPTSSLAMHGVSSRHGFIPNSIRAKCRMQRYRTVTNAVQEIEVTRPDDWHLHVRDGKGLESVVPHSARTFGRAIIMPNLVPPVTTTEMVCHVDILCRAASTYLMSYS